MNNGPIKHTTGFTLIELLIAMALIGIVLLILFNSVQGTTSAATQTNTRSELQQELLNAQRIVASRVQEALYVYPEGQKFDFGSSPLRKNPLDNSGTWITGTSPILAMILPPEKSEILCGAGANNKGCYRFFAYYPVKRSGWVGGTTNSNNPGADAANDSSVWVLAEYRDFYAGKPTFGTNGFAAYPTPDSSTKAYILADYITPTGTTAAPNAVYTMFEYSIPNPLSIIPGAPVDGPGWHNPAVPCTPAPCLADNPYVSGVTINLATQRKVGSSLTRLPGGTGTYTLAAAPQNIGVSLGTSP